ncbi:MAG: LysM domain-containing protein [Actinomycetota bacterium]
MAIRAPHRTTVVAGALVASGLAAVACGTTDEASRQTLPPIVTTTSSTLPPTSAPDDRQRAYEVKSGDTLGSIAQAFEVPIQSIIDLNNISNPDSIAIGTTLLIPTDIVLVDELPEPTETTITP